MSPVLPRGLVKLRPEKSFCKVRDPHNRLDHSLPLPAHIDVLGGNQEELLKEYFL